MESSIAVFLLRRVACEHPPTRTLQTHACALCLRLGESLFFLSSQSCSDLVASLFVLVALVEFVFWRLHVELHLLKLFLPCQSCSDLVASPCLCLLLWLSLCLVLACGTFSVEVALCSSALRAILGLRKSAWAVDLIVLLVRTPS